MDDFVTVDEYLNYVSCDIERRQLRVYFTSIAEFLSDIQIEHFKLIAEGGGTYKEILFDVRIGLVGEVNAYLWSNVIIVTKPFLDLCRSAVHINGEMLSDSLFPISNDDHDLIGMTTVRWVIGHELMHYVYHSVHWARGDKLTHHALECDADLISLAVIYRTAQSALKDKTKNDLNVKKCVLYLIFCVFTILRRIESNRSGDEHPALAMRFFFLLNKLTMLRENRNDPADINYSEPDTRRASVPLFELFRACEVLYKKCFPDEFADYSLYEKVGSILKDQSFMPLSLRLDEVIPIVRMVHAAGVVPIQTSADLGS